ncbi:MAG: serine protease [bacterium]
MKIIIAVLLVCMVSTLSNEVNAASVNIPKTTLGRVFLSADSHHRVATAFVAGDSHNVFVPAHAAIRDTMWYSDFGGRFKFRMTRKCTISGYDLAIYRRTGGEYPETTPIGNLERILPEDTVFYFAYIEDTLPVAGPVIVTAKGICAHMGELVSFIDFYGPCAPGCSGGPVFSRDGEVVAMIVQGWTEESVKTEESRPVLRAFSVDLLRIVESGVSYSTEEGSDSTGAGLSLFDFYTE